MSLNRTLDRFFTEIRREAKRNQAFAERLDAVFQAHQSGREVSEALAEEVVGHRPKEAPEEAPEAAPEADEGVVLPNPVGVLQKDGEDVLRILLSDRAVTQAALAALIAEHNLDPAGASEGADKDAMIDQIVTASARRIARDKKLFDY
jgi:hypothetical protein